MDKGKKTSSGEKMGMKKRIRFCLFWLLPFLDCWDLWLYSRCLQGFLHLLDQDVS